VASVENHTRLVEAAKKNLADARARQAGALSASVIGRIDGVEAGIYPVGPSRKTITAAGGFAGLIAGLAFVFLFGGPTTAGHVAQVESTVTENNLERALASGMKPRESAPAGCTCHQETAAPGHGAAASNVGLFSGMSLEQAMRIVERRG
jgi:hypothetical protein